MNFRLSTRLVDVEVRYVTEDKAVIDKSKTLPPFSRLTINVEDEDPRLAAASFSPKVHTG